MSSYFISHSKVQISGRVYSFCEVPIFDFRTYVFICWFRTPLLAYQNPLSLEGVSVNKKASGLVHQIKGRSKLPRRNLDTEVYVYEGVLPFQTQADKNVNDKLRNVD